MYHQIMFRPYEENFYIKLCKVCMLNSVKLLKVYKKIVNFIHCILVKKVINY